MKDMELVLFERDLITVCEKWKGPLEDCKRGSLRDIELPKYIIKTNTMSFSHVLNFQISGNMDEQLPQ